MWTQTASLRGPQGPPGSSATGHFAFQQLTPVATWTITHNLGYRPGGVRLYDSTGDGVEGDVSDVDDNTLSIAFQSAISGRAELS